MASPHLELEQKSPNPSTVDVDDPALTAPSTGESQPENSIVFPVPGAPEKTARPQPDDMPLVVHWDGPDDPANPRNWTTSRKWAAALVVSAYAFISPVSSSMVAPAAAQIAFEFGITSSIEVALTISVFVLAYAFGPLLFGPLSEVYGRTPILHAANIWFIGWNVGCAFAQNKGQLIAFRFLAGLGGSAPLATGGAVLSDLWIPSERGVAMAIYSLAPLLGPVIGPIAGGWIAELSTWRWVFRSTTIVAGVIQILGFLMLTETFAPVLLERKVKRVLQRMDAGEIERRPVRSRTGSADRNWRQILGKALTRPFAMLAQEPIIQIVGLYMAFVYGIIYLVLTTIPTIFFKVYHERPGISGLQYLSLGLGLMISTQASGRMLDSIYRRMSRRHGGVGKPEYRLLMVFPGAVLLPVGLLVAGWGAQEHAPWIVPDIGFFLVAGALSFVWLGMQTYIIDAFTLHAASALAAVGFLRSLAGFGFPLFAPAMYSALGYGVGNSILAGAAVGIGFPAIWAFWLYGERIRGQSKRASHVL